MTRRKVINDYVLDVVLSIPVTVTAGNYAEVQQKIAKVLSGGVRVVVDETGDVRLAKPEVLGNGEPYEVHEHATRRKVSA